jgi:hypothetical protein
MVMCSPHILIRLGIGLAVVILTTSCGKQQEEKKQQETKSDPHDHSMSIMTIEGIASGYDCAVVDVLCPSTHRAADYTTGLFTEGKAFYFVVNIPQSFMTQYFLEKLSLTGRVYRPYDYAIEPERILHVTASGEKRLIYEAGYFFDREGHKSLFNQGRVVDGEWACEPCASRR